MPIEWVGKYAAGRKAQFWQEGDSEARLNIIKSARNGGSITPPMSARLTALVKAGRLTLLTETTIGTAQHDGQWTLRLDSYGRSTTLDAIDHVVLATGSKLDVDSVPFLDTPRRDGQLASELGFPQLDEGLQARASAAPLFFTGALAALQVR